MIEQLRVYVLYSWRLEILNFVPRSPLGEAFGFVGRFRPQEIWERD